MMSKNYLTLLVFLSFMFEHALGQGVVDCRVVTGSTSMCNPYGKKLMRAKEITHLTDTKKLIISRTLPAPKKATMKVISVEDMMEKYLDVEDSLRFRGSEKTPFKVIVEEEPVAVEILEEKIKEIEVCKVPPPIKRELLEDMGSEKPQIIYGVYIVAKGDTLSKIAKNFGLETKAISELNDFKSNSILCVGQELKLPFDQKTIDAFGSAKYMIEKGDTLLSIAQKFNLEPKALANFNDIKSNTGISAGKNIKLPLPYVLEAKKKAEIKKKKIEAQKKSGKMDMLFDFGKRKLRVNASAYTSHVSQTNSSPFVAAWGTRLRSGMKVIAVSRDMLTKYGMRNGTKVRIAGLTGYYTVRDKMNKRYRKRIDIYMGTDRRRALRWGRRSVVISW